VSHGRKERTPAQLAVLAQAREKAKIFIAERAKLNALAKKEDSEPDLGLRGWEFCPFCPFFANFSTHKNPSSSVIHYENENA